MQIMNYQKKKKKKERKKETPKKKKEEKCLRAYLTMFSKIIFKKLKIVLKTIIQYFLEEKFVGNLKKFQLIFYVFKIFKK